MTRYTLTSRGRTLGHTGTELPQQSPAMRGWHFIAAPAFADVAPTFAALPAAIEDSQDAMPTASEIDAIPEAERESRIREILLADPRTARFVEVSRRLEALGLEVRDERGAALRTESIGVTEVPIPADAFAELLASIEPGTPPSSELSPPLYLLVVSLG